MKTFLISLTCAAFLAGCGSTSDINTTSALAASASPSAWIHPDQEFDANHCEFFVNSVAVAAYHYSGGGYDERVFVSYLSVNTADLVTRQGGKILQVGMRLNGRDDVISKAPLEPSYYTLRQSLWVRGYRTSDYHLRTIAYFIDVRRAEGTTVRLWLKDGAHDFQWPEVFDAYPKHVRSLGPSQETYVLEPSPLFNQRKACR